MRIAHPPSGLACKATLDRDLQNAPRIKLVGVAVANKLRAARTGTVGES
ncbi:hypothetical protein FTUN_5424 [Frigoriglobus tundricola]|uniref:Uncharacterized protein n=1 Tax=Frigoriglobus tundricola TaxID=2774151 RepID=A0A6M5YWL2_9BACT|nr:hypothetical protein FTUN_5424 [Frigoriglobus tundricola]